jgi:hypothetical protein
MVCYVESGIQVFYVQQENPAEVRIDWRCLPNVCTMQICMI